jgi:hypothetical protein
MQTWYTIKIKSIIGIRSGVSQKVDLITRCLIPEKLNQNYGRGLY